MTRSNSWFSQLMARRVPQIVGLYIAATWMTVEIGDWVSDQLGWPDQVVFYVFVLMVALMPSVVMLAWNHGAPGRDHWPRYEKWVLPVNSVVGLLLVFGIVGTGPIGTGSGIGEARGATVERVLIDEGGEEQVFVVAREGFHRRISSFFWTREDGAPASWENYAIAWLLAVDLGRDPLLTVRTPWKLGAIEQLQAAGFEQAVGEPVSLDLQIARENQAGMMIRGRYESGEPGYRLYATVIEVATGRVVAEHEAFADTLITAVSQLGDQLGPVLYGDTERDPGAFVDLELADAATASPEALRNLVDAINTVAFERDFERAAELVEEAVRVDPGFALAYDWMRRIHLNRGDLDRANRAAEQALALDYKLDSNTLFQVKAGLYGAQGEFDKSVRVHEMWTEVHPDSIEAWLSLARLKINAGNLDAARAALDAAREADPNNAELIHEFANLLEISGRVGAAAQILEGYLQDEPDDVSAWIHLGALHFRAGNYALSRDGYERAAILSGDSFTPELGLARTEAWDGDLEAALAATDQLIDDNGSATQFTSALISKVDFLYLAGRLEEAIAVLDEHEAEIRRSQSPLAFPQLMGAIYTGLYISLGRYDEALAKLNVLEKELVSPLDTIVDFFRVRVYEQTGDVEAARESMARLTAFRAAFDFSGVEGMYSWSSAQMAALEAKPEEAAAHVEEALLENRATARALDIDTKSAFELTKAGYLREIGRADEARQLAASIVDRHENYAEARLEMAEIDFETGELDSARRHVNIVLEQWSNADPDYRAFQRALALDQALP